MRTLSIEFDISRQSRGKTANLILIMSISNVPRVAMDYSVRSVKADSLKTSDQQLANIQNYTLSVQAAVGPKVLDGGGLQGRVLVAFSLGGDGALLGVRVAQSSGHERLDNQAVQLVGRASFPEPPAAFSISQRTYLSAFTFK